MPDASRADAASPPLWQQPPARGDEPLPPPGAPRNLQIRSAAPRPLLADEADLGIAVPTAAVGRPRHRLVAIGDSLVEGFQSFAIHHTDRSWPALVARALGVGSFSYPRFDEPPGCEGLPFDLEEAVRRIDETVGERSARFDPVGAASAALEAWAEVRRYWDAQGPRDLPTASAPFDDLGIWGWDVRDAMSKTWGWCADRIDAREPLLRRIEQAALGAVSGVSFAMERTALRTLGDRSLAPGEQRQVTQLSAAQALSRDGGIETLLVALGANNALNSVIRLELVWSQDDGYRDLEQKLDYTVWTPDHFRAELAELVQAVRAVGATHTVWLTVPHVTVVPLLHGVGEKPVTSRYFARYTRPWISDDAFDADVDPCLTGDDARAIDAAIDEYNYAIKAAVATERQAGRDWLLVDLCGLLDRIAYRRYIGSPQSRPSWWEPLAERDPVLPPELRRLFPVPDTRFFTSDRYGRSSGGLIGLDGVHPTTIGYGVIAQNVLDVLLRKAGVQPAAGAPGRIDFAALIEEDSLVAHPPTHLDEVGRAVGWIGRHIDLAEALRGWRGRTVRGGGI